MTNSNCKLFLGLELTSYIQAADDSKRSDSPVEHSALSEIVSLVYISDITKLSSFYGKIFRKKSMLENFRANVLKLLYLLIIIKFPYNAHSDWLKQRTLSENKEQVNDIKLAFKFLLRNFDKFERN